MRCRGLMVALLVVALAGGCRDGSPSSDDAATSDPSLLGAGDPVPGIDGLVVPEGAAMAGTTFPATPLGTPITIGALFTIHDDPFAVYDALAEQLRDLNYAINGSGAACSWLYDEDGVGQNRSVRRTPPDDIDSLHCQASGFGDAFAAAGLDLVWGKDQPGTVWLTTSQTAPPAPDNGETPDTEPAPSDAAALLPDRGEAESPEEGDAFGGSSNCFSGAGVNRFRLPADARLVATEGQSSTGRSVLVVDDAPAAISEMLTAAGGGTNPSAAVAIDTDTRAAWPPGSDQPDAALGTIDIMAGGGSCAIVAGRGGKHILTEMHFD